MVHNDLPNPIGLIKGALAAAAIASLLIWLGVGYLFWLMVRQTCVTHIPRESRVGDAIQYRPRP